jgi:hypothetical protein
MNSEGMRYCTGMSDAIQIEPSTGFCRYFPRAISGKCRAASIQPKMTANADDKI